MPLAKKKVFVSGFIAAVPCVSAPLLKRMLHVSLSPLLVGECELVFYNDETCEEQNEIIPPSTFLDGTCGDDGAKIECLVGVSLLTGARLCHC